ncbi:hypothetical protein HPB49_020186 [Dermacentor silvarum]|uniref:Uncharacterized protein n=1 Tax=Dermacentor silvarum TaxID=543639 RepID=A0ACB8DR22_DERSI|nr:hypothetical protein HPB49_020186 [Dermacentor silvarum]
MDLSPCLYTKLGPRYMCLLCDFSTKVTENIDAHMHAHRARSSSLYVHFGQHWQCLVCGYISKLVVNMLAHVRTHTGEKPYKCHLCPYACAQSGNLTTHIRSRHPSAFNISRPSSRPRRATSR